MGERVDAAGEAMGREVVYEGDVVEPVRELVSDEEALRGARLSERGSAGHRPVTFFSLLNVGLILTAAAIVLFRAARRSLDGAFAA